MVTLRNYAVATALKEIFFILAFFAFSALAKRSEKATPLRKGKRHDDLSSQADKTPDVNLGERIVHHVDDREGTKYIVEWYGYSPAEHNREPFHHIPQLFTRGCWEYQQSAEQQSRQVSVRS